jgi:hypothetical protein
MYSPVFSSQLEKFDSDLWMFHFMIPDDVVQAFLQGGHKRVVCEIDGLEPFQCALMPKGDGQYFINLNKERRKKLGLHPGARIKVQLKVDQSTYGLPMPEELGELLKMDDEGNRLFHQLTPGKQRSLIHIVGKPRRPETRLRKAVVIVDYLKAAQGKLDFKALNEAFKQSNRF